MKKILVTIAVITSFWSSQAFAWGAREQGILSGVAGLWVYQQLSRPPVAVYQQPPVVVSPPPVVYQQPPVVVSPPPVVYQQPPTVYVYPTNVPIPPNMICNLHSEMVNGQVVTGNYCYYR
jgi:hypothetical protein